jgi:hypothetical protein
LSSSSSSSSLSPSQSHHCHKADCYVCYCHTYHHTSDHDIRCCRSTRVIIIHIISFAVFAFLGSQL